MIGLRARPLGGHNTNKRLICLLVAVCTRGALAACDADCLRSACAARTQVGDTLLAGDIGWEAGSDREKFLCPDSLADITKHAAVRKYLGEHKVYISLTTMPSRILSVHKTLAFLDLTLVEAVLLHLPDTFGWDSTATADWVIPDALASSPKLRIVRHTQDHGPMLKITGATSVIERPFLVGD